MRTIQLTPSQNKLTRNYLRGEEVFCVCDTTLASFIVTLPDCTGVEDVIFNFINVGANILTISCLTRQNISGTSYFTLKQWETARLIIDSATPRYLVVDKRTNRFGSETNYSEFDTDGFQTAYGDAQGWDDISVPIGSGKVPAVNYPDWTPFTTNLSAYTFKVNDKIDCSTVEWTHGSLENGIAYIHVHWANNTLDTTNRYVKYRVRYSFSKNGIKFPDDNYVESSTDILIPANTAHRTSFMSYIGQIDLTGYGIGTQIKTGFVRVAATGAAPTNPPFIGQIGIHNKRDTPLGSKEMTSK